jgi:uncharacterized membrane-anchored protein
MSEQLKNYVMNAVLVVVIFCAVMLVGARLLDMTIDELTLDFIAGAIGGLAVVALTIWNSRKAVPPINAS